MTPSIPVNLDLFKSELDGTINRLSGYRRGNRSKAAIVVLGSAVGSALTTVLVGLASLISDPLWSSICQGGALVFSGSLTVLAAWEGLYNHKRLWKLQAGVLRILYRIQSDIKHLEAAGTIDQETTNALYRRYQAAFDEYNSQWDEMRSDEGASHGA